MEAVVKSLFLKLALQGLGHILPIVLLYWVSGDVYGDYVVQNTYALVTATILGFSLGNTHIFFDNRSSFVLLLYSSIVLSVLLLFVGVLIDVSWLILAAVYSLQKFNNSFLRDKRHVTKFFLIQILERVFFLALVFLSANTFDMGYNTITLMVIAASITTVPLFLFLFLTKYGYYSKEGRETPLKDLISWSNKGHLGVVAQKINTKFDVLLLSLFLSNTIVGYYYILVSLSMLAWTLPDALNSFLLSELVKSEDNKKRILIKKYTKMVFFGALGCLLVYMAWGRCILSLYSGFPVKHSWMLVVLTIGTGFFALAKPKTRYFTSINQPSVGSKVALIGLANTACILPLLAWWFGMSGAVIASSIGYIVSALYVLKKPMNTN